MSELSALKNTPDISFIDGKTVDEVQKEMIADYEAYISAAEGKTISLSRASVHRAIINAAATQIYLAMQYIDRAGKQNLLKYAYGDFLDNLALLRGVQRRAASAATATIKFTASAARTSAIGIPKGTRVAPQGEKIFFATAEYAEIPAGETTVTVSAACTEAGEKSNAIAEGELTVIVDPVPYVASATNTTASAGGAEIEDDDALRERIYLAPSSYSTAGPAAAYIYHAKQYSAAVGDVAVSADHDAGEVKIVFLAADGSTPSAEMIQSMQTYLSADTIRPLTDKVTVSAPTDVNYTINLTYYIGKNDSAIAESIQTAVTSAVQSFAVWQRSIGRDINPSKLTALVMAAGAKRVNIKTPVYSTISSAACAKLSGSPTITYGGIEDD